VPCFLLFFISSFASFTNIATVFIEFWLSSGGCPVPFLVETWLSRLGFVVSSLVPARRCCYRILLFFYYWWGGTESLGIY
jgi:hypothetical protein